MAHEILNNLLNFKIPPKEILEWLTTDNFNDMQWIEFNKNCPREEFIVFFLNYLRDQFTSALQNVNSSKQTPVKKILPQPQTIETSDSSKLCKELHFIKKACDQRNETGNTILSLQKNILSESCSASGQKNNLDSNVNTNIVVTPIKPKTKDSPSAIIQNSVKNINSYSPNTNPQTSTPVIKKKNPHKKRIELVACSPSQSRTINPAFQGSFGHEQNSSILDSKSISFDYNSFPSLGENSSNNLNVSSLSNVHKNESSDLYHSNLSQKSNISVNDKILQSPVSPLYSNSISMLSPIYMKIPQDRYSDNKPNITNTPERTSNNVSKHSKSTPRQNLSLADFIVTEPKSSKKISNKKNNNKILLRNNEQRNHDEQSISSETTPSNLKRNQSRKKVNPTRLNVTDEKGNKENAAFGSVSRPFTQNPQFVNVSPIDKSVDNESFQVERGLLKMERQKKSETTTNTNTSTEDTAEEKKQPIYKILSRNPSKVMQPSLIIIPSKELGKNVKVLDVLAELYSGFLDHNLVVNPMTELYFIIHLITTQYTSNNKKFPVMNKVSEKTEADNTELNDDSNEVKKNLSSLRKSLNFDDLLNDVENDVNENKESNDENNTQCNRSTDKLECMNLADDKKEHLNQINEELKEILINSRNEITNEVRKENSIEEFDSIDSYKKIYLGTPHNCVYFSTQVLNHQKAFLKYLDRVTLKLLCENNQIAAFQPELCKYLDTIYSLKVAELNKIKSSLNYGIADLNVSFQIDTDNCKEFSSTVAFHSFRKQRDMFYEILKIWQDNHLVPHWTFQLVLGGKIKTMLGIHTDITNFTHFARLFISQMLISCIQSGQQEDLFDDETVSFLKNLKDSNPEKLTQLQKKLVTPLSQEGPVPLPSFPGVQEFYKDFILYASNSMFYTYLEDFLIYKIMELNNSKFAGSDIEETETEVDERTKHNFTVCLFSLRLLSKFLGFLTSLPYRSETSTLENVINSQAALRSMCLPRIDLQYCLQIAVMQGKLSLTVPWIVEYLAMMDHASLRTPYYKKVLEMLYCIYRASNYHAITKSDELMSHKTAILVKFIVGWLFELPVFPKEIYYSWQSKYNDTALKAICEIQPSNKIKCGFNDVESSVVSVKHSFFLDKLDMVDDKILYSCCPFLRELNILLTPGNSSVNNSTSYRHVTPVTSQLQKPRNKTNTKSLEIQLEEAFFHGQPMSTRKTVEYVSERVASACVKYIYNNLLPVERSRILEALKNVVEENYAEELEKNPELVKKTLLKDMHSLSVKAAKNIKEKSEEVIPKICESRITQSIDALLADDCVKSVKNTCVKIAIRMAAERTEQWIQSHIVGGTTFIKDMEIELVRAFKSNDEDADVIDKNKNHDSDTASPTDITDEIRKIIWDLLETKGKTTTVDDLSKLWNQIHDSLMDRSDLTSTSEQVISVLTVDLCLYLITYRMDLFTPEIQEKVFKVWKIDNLEFSDPKSPLSTILNPRNVLIMNDPGNANVWLHCGKFLKKLLQENVLSIDTLSVQAVALFRSDWPIPLMKNLSLCLKEAIDGYRSSDEKSKNINLLQWVACAFNDMDQDSFCLNSN